MVASGEMSTTTRIALPGRWAGVVLDMDGLLVDTEPLWLVGKRIMFERHRTPYDHTDHLAVYGRDDLYTAEYFAGRFGLGHEAVEPIRLEYLALVGSSSRATRCGSGPGAGAGARVIRSGTTGARVEHEAGSWWTSCSTGRGSAPGWTPR